MPGINISINMLYISLTMFNLDKVEHSFWW